MGPELMLCGENLLLPDGWALGLVKYEYVSAYLVWIEGIGLDRPCHAYRTHDGVGLFF